MKNHCFKWAFSCALILSALILTAPLSGASTIFSTSPSLIIDSMDFDEGGDLYYLRTDLDFGAPVPQSTALVRRTLANGYLDPVTVFDFGTRVFGSFVTTTSTRVFFGESSNGTIRSVALDGSDPMLHGTVALNFDLAFSPGGEAFVSANSGFGQTNEILHFDTSTGATQTVVTNTNDFSGPVDFDSIGNLYYGGTGSPFALSPPTDIFQFSAAQIGTALTTATPIDLSATSSFASTPGSSHFAFVEDLGLFSHPPDGVAGGLILVDTATGSSAPVPGGPVSGTLGSMSHNGSSLYGVVTDFSTSTSDLVLIPEPSRTLLMAVALLAAGMTRRRFGLPARKAGPMAAVISATALLALGFNALAGPYPPAAGQTGSTAINYASPDFLFWADGHENFQQGIEGYNFDVPDEAHGQPTGETPDDVFDIVSMGRGGQITLTFPDFIADGDGADFAVFENSFLDTFLELAYVEVSNDGVTFVRFPNTSLTQSPVPSYGAVDATNIDGLAGKYRVGYGTPFDLGSVGLTYATHVRIVDIVGDGNAVDSQGNPIYDPYPTEGSAGFDLDAVGALNDSITFTSWQASKFDASELADPDHSGPAADPDLDELCNLLEDAFDREPELQDLGADIFEADASGANLVVTFTRNSLKKDITYHIEMSDNLGSWEEVARSEGGAPTIQIGSPGAAWIQETGSGITRTVDVADSAPIATTAARSSRIRVTLP